jgi:AcrR family transcriptional regulator
VAVRDQRADARRNAESILDAAISCLTANPDATVGEIAEAAGVGRVTLYGHFKTRAELVDAVFEKVNVDAAASLGSVDTGGDVVEAFGRLLAATWRIVRPLSSVLHAAQRELPAERIRGHHDIHIRRLDALVARGQRTGVFRTDVPRSWLVTTCVTVMHAAAEESAAGRLRAVDADRIITTTLLAALTPLGRPVPG